MSHSRHMLWMTLSFYIMSFSTISVKLIELHLFLCLRAVKILALTDLFLPTMMFPPLRIALKLLLKIYLEQPSTKKKQSWFSWIKRILCILWSCSPDAECGSVSTPTGLTPESALSRFAVFCVCEGIRINKGAPQKCGKLSQHTKLFSQHNRKARCPRTARPLRFVFWFPHSLASQRANKPFQSNGDWRLGCEPCLCSRLQFYSLRGSARKLILSSNFLLSPPPLLESFLSFPVPFVKHI